MRNLWIAIITLMFALPLAAWGVAGQKADPLQVEAERIFQYDREHPHRLPAHLLRRLSLAVAFHDDPGARKLIRMLSH